LFSQGLCLGFTTCRGVCLPLTIFERRRGGGLGLIGRLLFFGDIFCIFVFQWQACRSQFRPVGGVSFLSLLSWHKPPLSEPRRVYRSLSPRFSCCLIHLWPRFPLGSHRVPLQVLSPGNVGSRGLLSRRRGCLRMVLSQWLLVFWRGLLLRYCILCSSILLLSSCV